jgi:16S rRNA processing protein RimM
MEAMVLNERMVKIGRVVKPFGTDGRVLVEYFTDSWEDFSRLGEIRVGRSGSSLAGFQHHAGRLICSVRGVNNRDQAEELRGSFLSVPKSQLPALDDGRYYHFDLLGCSVEDEHGRPLGQVADILQSGANDNWVVRDGEREFLVPAVKEYVLNVDLEERVVRIRVVEGLL